MEREREQADHAAMLRELNKNINDRMSEKEDLVHQVLPATVIQCSIILACGISAGLL